MRASAAKSSLFYPFVPVNDLALYLRFLRTQLDIGRGWYETRIEGCGGGSVWLILEEISFVFHRIGRLKYVSACRIEGFAEPLNKGDTSVPGHSPGLNIGY